MLSRKVDGTGLESSGPLFSTSLQQGLPPCQSGGSLRSTGGGGAGPTQEGSRKQAAGGTRRHLVLAKAKLGSPQPRVKKAWTGRKAGKAL